MRPWCSQFPSRPGDPASGDTGGSESRQASTKTATSLSNAWFQPPRAPAAQSSLGKPVWFSVTFVLPPSRSSRGTVTIVSIDIPSGIPYCDGGTALPSASEGDSVATNRSSGTISRYTPAVWYSCPSGDCMPIKRRTPTCRSISQTCDVIPAGPYQRMKCSGSVHARHTSSRGASNTRSITTPSSAVPTGVLSPAALVRLLATLSSFQSILMPAIGRRPQLQFAQVIVQPIEAFFPELAVAFPPVRHLLQRRGRKPARPPLRVTASLDQSRPLQHLQMLRYRRHAHLERRRQLGHRRLTVHQPRQNRPSRRISQRRERRTQGIGRSTHRRHGLNHPVS